MKPSLNTVAYCIRIVIHLIREKQYESALSVLEGMLSAFHVD